MIQRLTRWLPLALLGVFTAALTFWLNNQVEPLAAAPDSKARHDPDYIIEHASGTRIGPDGKPRYTLSATRIVHYPDDDTSHLDAPKLVNFTPQNGAMTATAKKAILSRDGNEVYLMDDVLLVRSAYGNKSELSLRTSYLHIVPDKNLAQTDKPVEISDANTLITSVGLEFNNDTRILKLLSNVRSTYEKPKAEP